jgi:hypothetical protein
MVSPALPYAPIRILVMAFIQSRRRHCPVNTVRLKKDWKSKGQFVSGAMASIFEDKLQVLRRLLNTQSRAQALQRLQIPFRTIKVFWSDLIYKCVVTLLRI